MRSPESARDTPVTLLNPISYCPPNPIQFPLSPTLPDLETLGV